MLILCRNYKVILLPNQPTGSKDKYAQIALLRMINGEKLETELDTGAAISLIPLEQYESMLRDVPLQKTNVVLKT